MRAVTLLMWLWMAWEMMAKAEITDSFVSKGCLFSIDLIDISRQFILIKVIFNYYLSENYTKNVDIGNCMITSIDWKLIAVKIDVEDYVTPISPPDREGTIKETAAIDQYRISSKRKKNQPTLSQNYPIKWSLLTQLESCLPKVLTLNGCNK